MLAFADAGKTPSKLNAALAPTAAISERKFLGLLVALARSSADFLLFRSDIFPS
jgi:hypothetical protein